MAEMKIGNKLKLLRKMRKMTLKRLSEKSGVQIATLSRMEHDIMTGTLRAHMSICNALGVSLADFYREIEDADKTRVFAPGRALREPLLRSKGSVIEMLTSGISDKKMIPVLVRINKNASIPEERSPVGTEKLVYLLEGKIKATVGPKDYTLRKGDSLYFDASLSHAFYNLGKAESLLLSVSSVSSI